MIKSSSFISEIQTTKLNDFKNNGKKEFKMAFSGTIR